MASFFNNQKDSVTDTRLIKNNARAMRKTRIAQAETALLQLKNNIDERMKKLQGIFNFLDTKKALYTQLTQQYEKTSDAAIAVQLDKLKPAIERLETKLIQSQPERVIADLRAKYEALQLTLEQKISS